LTTPLSRLAAVGVIVLSCVALACSNAQVLANAPVKPEKDRHAAPDFALKDANGNTVRLSDYKGKVVLLDFWATWCGPCKVEIPWFIQFEQQYKDKGFAVLGVSMDEDGWSAVKPFIEEHKMNYRVALGNDQVSELYGGLDSLPTTLLVDRSGRIAKVHIGLDVSGRDAFENEITNLLASPTMGLLRVPGFLPAWLVGAR
jgi:peroxiredoxin